MYHIKRFIVYVCLIAPLGAIGQYTSFDFKFSEWSGRYVNTIETHDSSFLILTSHAIFKVNHRGKMLWSYDEIYNFTTNKLFFVNGSPIYYSKILTDEEGVYVFGLTYLSESYYYLHLDHNGRKLFDTVYLSSWLTERPMFMISTVAIRNNIFEANGEYYYNMVFNKDSTEYEFDYICPTNMRLNKRGEVLEMGFQRIVDSSHAVFSRLALKTADSGYLYILTGGPRFPRSWVSRNSSYMIARGDSTMQILWHKELLPQDQFPDFDLKRTINIRAVYGSDDTFVRYPRPMVNRIDRANYLVFEIDFSGSILKNRGLYYFIFDSEGNFIKYDKLEIPYKARANSYRERVLWNRDDVYELSYYDSNEHMLWSKLYKNVDGNYFTGYDDILDYKLSNSNGYITVFANSKLKWTSDDRQSNPYPFLLRHINSAGWDLGYDPQAWEEEMPIRVWFDMEGNLRVVEELEDWEITFINTVGQPLFTVKVPFNGKMEIPSNISSGVYILSFQSPKSKKLRYVKLFKE